MLKCILGCGSKGRCFLGGALLCPETENREEDGRGWEQVQGQGRAQVDAWNP